MVLLGGDALDQAQTKIGARGQPPVERTHELGQVPLHVHADALVGVLVQLPQCLAAAGERRATQTQRRQQGPHFIDVAPHRRLQVAQIGVGLVEPGDAAHQATLDLTRRSADQTRQQPQLFGHLAGVSLLERGIQPTQGAVGVVGIGKARQRLHRRLEADVRLNVGEERITPVRLPVDAERHRHEEVGLDLIARAPRQRVDRVVELELDLIAVVDPDAAVDAVVLVVFEDSFGVT